MLSVCYFAVYLFCGCLLIRSLLPTKRLPVRLWLGCALGTLLMMWLPALMAFFVRFSVKGHLLALIPLVVLTGLVSFLTRKGPHPKGFCEEDKRLILPMLLIALPLTALGGYLQYTHCLNDVEGMLHCGQSTYGDLPLHLAIISSLRDAAFPADYSILPGELLTYPFLADSFSTSFMLFGMTLRQSVIIPGTFMMAMVFAGYILLVDRIAGSRRRSVLFFSVLFVFINGGLGFLYSIDTLGVSNGSAAVNSLQAGTWMDRLDTIMNGYYMTPANHAEQSYYNLRWSNIVVDMLVPQRTFLGGWCLLLPCIYLLWDGFTSETRSTRQFVLLGVMAGGLPLLHTHSFLALGLMSAGWLCYDLLHKSSIPFRTRLLQWALYGGIACLLAAPQLFGWTFRHTDGNSGFVYLQFNWVNNAGGMGLRDGYLWFWIKNIGLPALFLILALFDRDAWRKELACGAFVIFIMAELVIFQPNEYDNNKLFYVWWALVAPIAADYMAEVYARLKGLRSRPVLAVMAVICCFATGTLSIARECKSDYVMFSAYDVEAAEFIEKNTPQHATFMCWTDHINPVSSLAGRNIVCGPALWLHWHGYDLMERQSDIIDFYADPVLNADLLQKYNVDYIYISDHERTNTYVNEAAIALQHELVFKSSWGSIRIYQVNNND